MPDAPFFEAQLLPCDDPRFPFAHASTIAANMNGDLKVAWYGGSREKANDVAILSSRLPRAHRHWAPARIADDTPGRSEGNPVLFQDPYGTHWLFWAVMMGDGWDSCIIRAKVSGDGGHSYDSPFTLQDTPGWLPRNKPVILRDDTVLLPMYDERDWHSFMLASTDAAHWEPRGEIRSDFGVIQPTVVELSDGTLLAYLRRGQRDPERRLWQSVSEDGGFTWTPAERTALPNPNSAADMVRLANGHLVLAFNNSPTDRTPLSLALSLDEGRSWRYVRNLEEGRGEYSYPAVIQTADGRIHVTYTFERRKIKHVALEEEWIRQGRPLPAR